MEVGPLHCVTDVRWSKMKWVILLAFLVLRNCISSQPLANENVRESRQLKIEECCPCPTAERVKDYNILDTTNVPPDCPCRAADSDTASSIFTPTSKAVQSFVRPFKGKDEPKPLLNPEVGLASSVLETLREATDKEYEDALARDAARSALQEMNSDAEEMPVSASTNVFGDILSPRYKETIDAMPEASYNEETRCIHPALSQINEFGYFEIQPQRNLLKDFSHSKPFGLRKNVLDMDNTPSNIQENILPAKNKILDDIKIKTNLLKSKLFANNKGMLQRMVPEKSFDSTYYNNPHKLLSDWKLVVPLDNLKSSKLFDSNSRSPLAENTRDFQLLNNDILRNNVQNNKKVSLIPLRKPSNKYVTDEALSSEAINFPGSKEVQRFKNTKDNNIDSNADTSILNPLLYTRDDCNLKKENIANVETITEKNDYPNVIKASTSNLPVSIPSQYSTEILDTIPSPSEITAEENQLLDPTDIAPHEHGSNDLPEINMVPKPDQVTHNKPENSEPFSITRPTDVQDTTNNLSIEKNGEEANKYIPETVCTTEKSKIEINGFYGVSTQDPITMNTDVFNFPINQNEEENINVLNAEGNQVNQIEENSESQNNLLDKNRENNFNVFPNIGEGLIKTFENVKKINEKWQEKIKHNVQDALQLVNVKNNIVMKKEPELNPVYIPEISAKPHKSSAKTSNSLSSHELQKMSDSILTLSSANQDSDPNFSTSVKEVSETEMDSNGEPSEIISCLTPAEVYNSKMSEEKPLNNKNQEIIRNASENQQNFRNLNTGMIYKDIGEQRRSKTPLEKSSLNIEVPRKVRIDENEMAAQASEPKPLRNTKIVLDNSKYLNQDFVVEPNNEYDEFGKSLLNVNNFFDNVKSTISNVFSTTNDDNFRQTEDNVDKNYKINNQGRTFDLEKPKLNLKKSAKFLKSPEAIQTETYTIQRYKPNLNPYRARIAVPESFDVKPILAFDENLDKRSGTFNNPPNILPKMHLTNTVADNSNENVENENLKLLFRESVHNNPNSESTVLKPNIFQSNFRSSGSKSLGSLKDQTEVALQKIHKTLDNPLRAVSPKENSRFVKKNIGNENLFETMASKRNEFNEKLQALNLDLNDRLSSLSHRMADSIWPSLNSHLQPQRKLTSKSRSAVRNKQGNLRRVNAPSDVKSALANSKSNTQSNDNFSVPKALKKSLISDRLSDLKSPRFYENSMSQRHTVEKPSPKTETKIFKPNFKYNRMISETSNIRPKTLISIKPPQTIKKVSTLKPKTSAPSSEKKPNVSRLKSGEPHSLGSENVMSRVLLDKETDIDKSAVDTSSDESDRIISNFKNIKAPKQEEARNFALTKLREALKAKMVSRDSNKKDINLKSSANTDLETVPSASENVKKEIDGSLRQNVQYKCKMLCTKDE